MKRKGIFLTAMAIYLLASCIPVTADENATTETSEQQTQQKDECLLLARNCGNSAISIQDKIERLKEEIAKGRAVYTVEELNNLKQKLEEVNRTLDFLLDK